MEWQHTYLTSFDKLVMPTLMLDAPLSRTMMGARRMMDLDNLEAGVHQVFISIRSRSFGPLCRMLHPTPDRMLSPVTADGFTLRLNFRRHVFSKPHWPLACNQRLHPRQ
jgi:hypothetical protein